MAERLTRSEIEQIVDGMTARDIFIAAPSQEDIGKIKGAQIAGDAFDSAADRQGFGEKALDRVGASDAIWLSERLGEVLNPGPKADDTETSLPSADIGDSVQS